MNQLIMVTKDGHFYPIVATGSKPLKTEAQDHLDINDHVLRVEDINGNVLADKRSQ